MQRKAQKDAEKLKKQEEEARRRKEKQELLKKEEAELTKSKGANNKTAITKKITRAQLALVQQRESQKQEQETEVRIELVDSRFI